MNNKLSIFKLSIVLLVGLLVSCKSNKEITFFQNLAQGEIQQSIKFSTSDYPLRVGDNLFIQVSSMNPEVSLLFNPSMTTGGGGVGNQYTSLPGQFVSGYQLDGDGNIELPIIGSVFLQGATIAEARKILDARVAEYFKEAMVSVKLLSFKYTLLGEVANPGVYYNYSSTCTILEAISNASGTTDYSKLRSAKIIREHQDGTYSIDVDLTDKSLLSSSAYYVQPNDVIYVSPDIKYKNTRLNAPLYSLVLSTISTAIVIVGLLLQ